jgi:hypothetical protein
MIDIFSGFKPQPKLYIADLEIRVTYKPRSNGKAVHTIKLNLTKYPVVLLDGDFPTHNSKTKFLKRVFDQYVNKGKFETTKMNVVGIYNCKYSSNLSYTFDYDND